MKYEDFIDEFKRRVHEELGYPLDGMKFYPEGYTSDDPVRLEWIRDSNLRFTGEEGTKLLTDFLTMDVPETETVTNQHRIAIRRMYEDAKKNGFDAAFQNVRDMYKEIIHAQVDEQRFEARGNHDYEKIRDQLILRPLNYDLHIKDLRGCVYRKVNDFVLCLYQVLSDTGQNLITSKIKRSEVEKWGVDEDQVIQNALENTARLYPACIFDKRTQKEENFLEKEFTREDITIQAPHNKLITLSTFRTINGAAALFYPGVIEKMIKILGGPFQAVFMNTNDIMIFDRNDGLAGFFAKTAKESGPMGEMLSGKVYLCDGKQMVPGIIVEVYSDGKARVEL